MRTEITKALEACKEDTAKGLAEEIGLEVKDVASELNAMLKDGLVEREKRKGNEYTYWLANPNKPSGVLVFSPKVVEEVIAEVAAETAEASKAKASPRREPKLMTLHVDTDLESAIEVISKNLPKGISLGIFSDGSIDVLDSSTDISYSPTPSNLRDCLDCFHKLQGYQQSV